MGPYSAGNWLFLCSGGVWACGGFCYPLPWYGEFLPFYYVFTTGGGCRLGGGGEVERFDVGGTPSPLMSLVPVVMLILLLFTAVRAFNDSTLDNNDRISLLAAATIYVLVNVTFCGVP